MAAVHASHVDVALLATNLARMPMSNTSQQREVIRRLLVSAANETIFEMYNLKENVEVVKVEKYATTQYHVTHAEIERRYRNLARHVHPDKNSGDASATAAFKYLVTGKEILMNPSFLQKYKQRMEELRNQRKREAGEDVNGRRWLGIGIAILIGCGFIAAAFATGGITGAVVGIIGSASLGSGGAGCLSLIDNRDISDDQLWQHMVKGGASGAAGGMVGAAAVPLVAASAAAYGSLGTASACAGVGALASVSAKGAEDVTEMLQGERDLWEWSSGSHYAKAAAIGGVAGGLAGSLGHKFCPADVVDDVAAASRRLNQSVGHKAIQAVSRIGHRSLSNLSGASVGQVAAIAGEAYIEGGLTKVDWKKAGQRALLGATVAVGSAVASSIGEQAKLAGNQESGSGGNQESGAGGDESNFDDLKVEQQEQDHSGNMEKSTGQSAIETSLKGEKHHHHRHHHGSATRDVEVHLHQAHVEPVTPAMLNEELDELLAQINRMLAAYIPAEDENGEGPVMMLAKAEYKLTPEFALFEQDQNQRKVESWTKAMEKDMGILKATKTDIKTNYISLNADTHPSMVEANQQLQRLEAMLRPQNIGTKQKAGSLAIIPPLDALQKMSVMKLSKLADKHGRDDGEDDEDDAGLKGEIIAWLEKQSASGNCSA